MKVFVAGGTGVVGWRAVRLLVQAGHEVSVIARSPEKADFVRGLGATPVETSLFDASGLVDAVAGHEVVVNLATHIPAMTKAMSSKAWQENDRIRIEGAGNLVDAAIAAGARRYVQESICFLYADGGERWLDEDAPLFDPAPEVSVAVTTAEAHAARAGDAGLEHVVLRFGYFHAADSEFTASTVTFSRWGRVAVLGPADTRYPIIHAEDAATAVVAALDAPSGLYNIVDDDPLTRGEYAAAFAEAAGDARRLRLPPKAMLGIVERRMGTHLRASQRVSNRRFAEATGWRPAYPSAHESIASVLDGLREPRRVRSATVALLLLFLAFGTALVGFWALLSPSGFYESFPGMGHAWVSVDGPFNEHLIRDVGALNLALTVVALCAAATMLVPLVRATAVAYLVYGVPHLLYHVTHLSHFGTSDQVGMVVSLGSGVVAAIAVLVLSLRVGRAPAASSNRPGAGRRAPLGSAFGTATADAPGTPAGAVSGAAAGPVVGVPGTGSVTRTS